MSAAGAKSWIGPRQVSDIETYEQLDDLRGTGAAEVTCRDTVAKLYTDRRWRNQNMTIVPLDAHGPWVITKRCKDGM